MPCRIAVLIALTSAGASEARAQAADRSTATPLGEDLPVRELELANGMRVLLLPREGAPTVSFVMEFGIGGVHERLGTTGVAHLLEHLLFKGTETIGTRDVEAERRFFEIADRLHDRLLAALAAGNDQRVQELQAELDQAEDDARQYVIPNELDRILTRAGAQGLNAMTTSESTSYFVELPSNRVELFFALEADRMSNPVFREFYTERDVVMEERRMRVDAAPAGALYEAHLSVAFDVHPYGVPVVGWMSDLKTLRREDVARYYRDFYGPNNAVLVVVGRFDPDEVEGWARRYLGPIPRGADAPPVLAEEPLQRGERRVEVLWDAEPHLRVGWHVPSATHPDAPALAVLSTVLTGGRSSRLYRRLVMEDRIASSVFSSMGPGSLYPRLFQIDVTPLGSAATERLEEIIYAEIADLARDGPTADEVGRFRTQIAASAVRRMQSNLGLAFALADAETLFGDWRESFRGADRLRAVEPEDVRRVAADHLRRDNRTIATLIRRELPR